MAVPTFVSITPSSGKTKGTNLVKIEGTNFRVPTIEPSGEVNGAEQFTVKVEFEGVESEWAASASDTIIYARVPEYTGGWDTIPATLDVRIANLDDDGDEIAGENVTESDAYTVDRTSFTDQPYLMRVTEMLIRRLKRHLMTDVGITISRDYDDDPTTVDRLRSNLPAIYVSGPDIERTGGVYHFPVNDAEENPLDTDEFVLKSPPMVVDLFFTVRGWADNPYHLYNMTQQLMLLFRDLPYLDVEVDPAQPDLGSVEYPVELDWAGFPDLEAAPGFSDLENFQARLKIIGVHIDEESGTIFTRGKKITTNDGEPTVETEFVGSVD